MYLGNKEENRNKVPKKVKRKTAEEQTITLTPTSPVEPPTGMMLIGD